MSQGAESSAGSVTAGRPDRSGRAPGTGRDEPRSDATAAGPAAFDALVKYARTVCTAHEWLHDLSQLERRLIATTAGALYGTELLEPDTVVIRRVFDELCKPSVLLGVGTCPYCGLEDVDNACPDPVCESNAPRRYRTFAQKWAQ